MSVGTSAGTSAGTSVGTSAGTSAGMVAEPGAALLRVHLIVAMARNGVIGKGGSMPWHLPEDLAHFKRTTLGHVVIMGRRTWDSIGRPLPGRRNLVVTRDPGWQAPGAQACRSLPEALACSAPATDVFVIGGAQLYAQALAGPVQSLHLTRIDADIEGDTIFPALEPGRWRECNREHLPASATRPYALDFLQYEALRHDRGNPDTP